MSCLQGINPHRTKPHAAINVQILPLIPTDNLSFQHRKSAQCVTRRGGSLPLEGMKVVIQHSVLGY